MHDGRSTLSETALTIERAGQTVAVRRVHEGTIPEVRLDARVDDCGAEMCAEKGLK